MNPFDIEIALPASTPYEIEGLAKPRVRLDIIPLTKDNPLWMEAGFLAFVEKKTPTADAPPETPDARAEAKESAKGIADAAIVGWAFFDAALDAWKIEEYTPARGFAFLSQLIDARGGLGIFAKVQERVYTLSKDASATVDAEQASGNSSGG